MEHRRRENTAVNRSLKAMGGIIYENMNCKIHMNTGGFGNTGTSASETGFEPDITR